MRPGSRIRNVIAASLMMLFVTYYVNATMFWHSHIINGVTIVHSHIHGAEHTTLPGGGHSSREVTLISLCSALQYLDDCQAFVYTGPVLVLLAVFLAVPVCSVIRPAVSLNYLRAPPYSL